MVASELIEKITEEHKILIIELLKRVILGETRVEYGELEDFIIKSFGVEINAHFSVPNKIGLISEICYELGLPMLSVVVVNKSTQLLGRGFYQLYDRLHKTHYTGNKNFENEIRTKTKAEVMNCKEWYKLTEFLGIEIEGIKRP